MEDYTLGSIHYTVIIKYPKSKTIDLSLIRQWCRENIGVDQSMYGYIPTILSSEPGRSHTFYFKNKEDAVLFELTWG